jgi:hypothetical protein
MGACYEARCKDTYKIVLAGYGIDARPISLQPRVVILIQESECHNIDGMKIENSNNKEVLTNLFRAFVNGIRSSKAIKPKEWLKERGLSYENLQIGFNSGQFHHRKSDDYKSTFIEIGVLTPSDAAVKSPELKAYTCFSPYSVVFPLKDESGQIVNLYAIRCKNQKMEYLNDDGLYPCNPHPLTNRLFITNDVMDAASLLESKLLNNRDGLLALHGGELREQHLRAIGKLGHLNVLVIFDNVATSVIQKLSASVLTVLSIKLPDQHSLNDMWAKYGSDSIQILIEQMTTEKTVVDSSWNESPLKELHKGRLFYVTDLGTFYVLGNISNDLATLKGTIAFEPRSGSGIHRNRMDLYERSHVINFIKSILETENINENQLESELSKLATYLEKYRAINLGFDIENKRKRINLLPPEKEREAIAFLSQPMVIDRIDGLIEAFGIVGEENARKMVFVIASTYKMGNPLHGIIQGTSGSGKTHLINSIGDMMPPEDVMKLTRATSKSFYHYKEEELVGKLVLIQDLDGLDAEAMFAFRELQSAGFVNSSTIKKDSIGNLQSVIQVVKGRFASLAATTHAEIYFDNLSRSIVFGVDESVEQTLKIIDAQNRRIAGLFDSAEAFKGKELLQNCMRVLKPYEVINTYANQIKLPLKAKMQRRLNGQYQDMVKQITLLNQFRRKHDEQGRLSTEVEDLILATEIMFDSIMWKVDELDSSLRQFFDRVKTYLSKQENRERTCFSAREIRQVLNIERSQMHRNLLELVKLEYIKVTGGSSNRGYLYTVSYWDDIINIRQGVKDELMNQIEALKESALGR